MDKNLREEYLSTEEIFEGNILHVIRDTVKLPNDKPATREVIRHIGAVCVVPVTSDNKVIMERQYRYPMDEVIWEIPAGKLDSKTEDRLLAAKRELREETGYEAEEWIDLGMYYPAAAYSDERLSMYMAKGLHKGERDLDDDEFLDVYEVPIEDLVKDIMDGKIMDGKTQVAILKAYKLLNVCQ